MQHVKSLPASPGRQPLEGLGTRPGSGQAPAADPTGQLYPELQRAYAFFNERLFEGTLPSVLITLQRRHQTEGYWAPHRFANRTGGHAGELALNPCYFAIRSLKTILATLVHAQVHVWQTYFGAPGRRGYHNREWADKMLAVGLHPSSTERPGGAETGESVGHYIVPGGPFDQAAAQLIASDDFALTWYDRYPAAREDHEQDAAADIASEPSVGVQLATTEETVAPGAHEGHSIASLFSNAATQSGRNLQALQQAPAQLYPALAQQMHARGTQGPARTRHKFSCPDCGAAAWGKPSLRLKCEPCGVSLRACDAASSLTPASPAGSEAACSGSEVRT